jgi:cytochrome bd-type quinol oxidase subunit 2
MKSFRLYKLAAPTDTKENLGAAATPFAIRAFVAVMIGVGLVSGWLQPFYETVVLGGGVRVPGWWAVLHLVSLPSLLLLCIFFRKRDRHLSIVTWCAFWASLLSNVMPGYC